MPEAFDDFLGLAMRDFSRSRLIVFHGCSGSGKSTAIDWLVASHRDFAGRAIHRIDGPPFEETAKKADVVIVDEVFSLREIAVVVRALMSARTVVVASHVTPFWFRCIAPFTRKTFFRTDRDSEKIVRHLHRLEVPATRRAIEIFVSRYGATYTDLEIILERSPAPTFDASLAHFTRFASIRLSPHV